MNSQTNEMDNQFTDKQTLLRKSNNILKGFLNELKKVKNFFNRIITVISICFLKGSIRAFRYINPKVLDWNIKKTTNRFFENFYIGIQKKRRRIIKI